MDFTLILIIIVLLGVIYLIFKLIKKMLYAVLTVILVFVLLFAGIGSLVYLDVKALSEKQDFKVHLIQGTSESPDFGVVVEVANGEIQVENIASVDTGVITEEVLDDTEDFYIFIPKEVFEDALANKSTYYLEGTQDLEVASVEVQTGLSGKDVRDVMNSQDSMVSYVDTIIENNAELAQGFEDVAQDLIRTELETTLDEKGLSFKEALFSSVVAEQVQGTEQLKYLSAYKEKDLEVVPDRITFKLLRMLPLSYVEEKITELTE